MFMKLLSRDVSTDHYNTGPVYACGLPLAYVFDRCDDLDSRPWTCEKSICLTLCT